MAVKILSFSRTYPAYHSRKGESTYFVEAILEEIGIDWMQDSYFNMLVELNPNISLEFLRKFFQSLCFMADPKKHTIRTHARQLKVGDSITPVCWAGKPYNKTEEGYWQIVFAPNIEVKQTWNFEIDERLLYVNGWFLDENSEEKLAQNDGLSRKDLLSWFKYPEPKTGYIICWDEKLTY